MNGSEQQLTPVQPSLTTEQLQREVGYRAAMETLRLLCRENVLTQSEARRIKQKLAAIFSPVWADIA